MQIQMRAIKDFSVNHAFMALSSLIVCRLIACILCTFIYEVNAMDIIKVFGTNLRYYRKKLGISQEKFGEMCGLHRTYISDVERFNRSISLDNIQKIADALGIETYKLFIENTQEN